MAYPPNAANKYKNAAIESASKEKLLLMLYEGAIRNMRMAKKALEEKRIADKGMYLGKAHDIVAELANSLDHSVGGKMAEDLEGLYFFLMREITEGNLKNDSSKFDNVIQILETLFTGWKDAIDIVRKDRPKT